MSVEVKKSTLITFSIIAAVVLTVGSVVTALVLLNNQSVQPGNAAQNTTTTALTRVPQTTATSNTITLKVNALYGDYNTSTANLTDVTDKLGSVELFEVDCTVRDLTQSDPRCPRLNKNPGNVSANANYMTFPNLTPGTKFDLVPRPESKSIFVTVNGQQLPAQRSQDVLVNGQLVKNVLVPFLSGSDAVQDAFPAFSSTATTFTDGDVVTFLYKSPTIVPDTTTVTTTIAPSEIVDTTIVTTTVAPATGGGTTLPSTGIVEDAVIPTIIAGVALAAAFASWKFSLKRKLK